jgi:hypothetical protein
MADPSQNLTVFVIFNELSCYRSEETKILPFVFI